MKIIYTFCRYFVAFVILFYGFAKINEAQFTILDSELDKPMREVSGFWLTWYYFGYSQFYGNFIALVQIVAGIMLLFRKTTLLGSCILFGVVGNIILIDIFYGVARSALFTALLLEACLVFLLWQHKDELRDLFWTRQNKVYEGAQAVAVPTFLKYSIRLFIIVVPLVFTYFIANFNNRLPTPLDGRWEVVDASGGADVAQLPTHIYFEHNRAWMCVFRYPDAWETHHFEVDEQENTIEIWDKYMSKGEQLFSGSYDLKGNDLVLQGHFTTGPLRVTLRKME